MIGLDGLSGVVDVSWMRDRYALNTVSGFGLGQWIDELGWFVWQCELSDELESLILAQSERWRHA